MSRDWARALRSHGLRFTPQRRAILDSFDERDDEHLAADEVHARAAATVPELSRGTVYSALAEFTELGLLSAFGSPEPVRYETNTGWHSHFRCRLCLRLFDVHIPAPDVRSLAAQGFVVEHVTVTAEGTCADCGAYERGLEAGATEMLEHAQVSSAALDGLAAVRHETAYGPLLIAASAAGIVRIAFEEHADYAPFDARARSRRGARKARARVSHLIGSLDAYLAGAHEPADDTIDWTRLPERNRAALEAVMRIPYGQARSYERLGRSVSAFDCGYALGTNPLPFIVPCHRVTRGGSFPEAYVGGIERRRRLNAFERE